jgi:DNA-binding transcriptional MerR regulator
MSEGGYSSTQVCRITQVPYGTLFEWMSTGVITPSLVKPQGRGKRIRWDFRDLIAIRTIRGLRERNVSLQGIRKAVAYIQQQFDIESPLSECWLATDGHELYTLDADVDGKRLLALRKHPGQITMLLCVELRRTADELRTLLQPNPDQTKQKALTPQHKPTQRRRSA